MRIVLSFHRLFLSFLFLAFLCSSCEQKEDPVTADEAKAFATKIESSIEKRNPDFYNNAIDKNQFLKKTGIKGSARQNDRMKQHLSLGNVMINAMSKKGLYNLVKQYEKENVQHLLFRLYDDGSLNYHDIELTRSKGEIKIADLFVYTSGELLSETIKTLYQQTEAIVGDNPSLKNDSWITQLPKMKDLVNKGKHEEALTIFNNLSPDIQKLRAIQLMHVIICSGLNDNERYSKAIEDYKQLYPNEPNMHLLLLDGFVLKKEYGKALHAVNEMDRMINKDPLLDYYRFLLYKLDDKKDSGRIYLERLGKTMPNFEDGLIEIINLHLENKEYEAARPLIEKFRNRSSYTQSTLDAVLNNYPDYAE